MPHSPAPLSAVRYQSLPVEVGVTFADAPGTVQTLEGVQVYSARDAIITGIKGERWPVRIDEFKRRYEAVSGVRGRYRKRAYLVTAEQIAQPRVIYAPSGAVLRAEPGSWVVHGTDGSISVVDPEIFAQSYALASIPVYISLAQDIVTNGQSAEALNAFAVIQRQLPSTPLIIQTVQQPQESPLPGLVKGSHSPLAPEEPPVWFRVVVSTSLHRPGDDVLELPLSMVTDLQAGLNTMIARECSSSPWSFSVHYVKRGIRRLFEGEETIPIQLRLAASRLASVEAFNAALSYVPLNKDFQRVCSQPSTAECPAEPIHEPAGLRRVHELASVADSLASTHQRNWQEAVFTRTGLIARATSSKCWLVRWFAVARLFLHNSLASLGLLAAIGFATFSELAGGCTPDFPLAFLCASEGWKHYFESFVFLFLYTLTLGAAWFVFARTKARKDETRHQDFRLLAECLRARYVGALLHEGGCVSHYVRGTAESEAGWVRDALRSLHFSQPVLLQDAHLPDVNLERARQDFIREQLDYHTTTLIKSRTAAASLLGRLGRRSLAVFIVAFVGMISHEAFELFRQHSPYIPELPHILTSVMVVALAFWGSMRKLLDVFGLKEEVERAEVVADALSSAQAGDHDAILHAINVYAQDQGKWHELHRGKSIEAAMGG